MEYGPFQNETLVIFEVGIAVNVDPARAVHFKEILVNLIDAPGNAFLHFLGGKILLTLRIEGLVGFDVSTHV